MPKYESTLVLKNPEVEPALINSFETMKRLGWMLQFAGTDKLVATTYGGRGKKSRQIIDEVDNGPLFVSSSDVDGAWLDLRKSNQKNVADFVSLFQAVEQEPDPAYMSGNLDQINKIRNVTVIAWQEAERTRAELNEVMNLSGSNLYATYNLIGINIIIFILMVINGAGIIQPNGYVHIKWGSNYLPLTLSGDWWRLITNVFIHFGVIHLLMNMYCLYIAGTYLEPMLGKMKFITAYLCTGVIASLVSLWWHKEGVNSAGASGAVFGLFGLFFAFLTTKLIPQQVRMSLLKSIGIFIFYNLAFGMTSGVDNAAHVGGLVSGFIIGYIYMYALQKQKAQSPQAWIVPALVAITFAVTFTYLGAHRIPAAERQTVLGETKDALYKDYNRFNKKLKVFAEREKTAMTFFAKEGTPAGEVISKLKSAMGYWLEAEQAVRETAKYEVSEQMHSKTAMLMQYVEYRKTENRLISEMAAEPGQAETARLTNEFDINNKLLLEILKKLNSE